MIEDELVYRVASVMAIVGAISACWAAAWPNLVCLNVRRD